jgi:hypothetical protein
VQDHFRPGDSILAELYGSVQALQDGRNLVRAIAVDGHQFLAPGDLVADVGVEDEPGAVGDGILLEAAAGPGVDGGHAHREGIDARDMPGDRGGEFRLP